MIEKAGAGKYALPVFLVILIGCVMALMFYPMLNMAPKELPFAVLSLDEGAQTPQGDANAGEMMADRLVNAEAPGGQDPAPIAWRLFDDQEQVDAALADNELYGVLTIPPGFTRDQALAQAGQGEAPRVDVVLDHAKSPIAAAQMRPVLGTMFEQMQVPADIEVINTGDASGEPKSPVAEMMGQQIGVMPLMVMSLAGSILLTRIFPKQSGMLRGRFTALGTQLAYAAGLSLLAAVTAVVMLDTLVSAQTPFWTTTAFLWTASFSVMALFLGSFGIAVPIGALVVLFALICGMMTAVLPAEMLPAFWADWIYPWSPQHFIGDGIRDILYRGADLMPAGTGGLLMIGGVGLVLLVLSGFLPSRGARSAAGPAPAAVPESSTAL